MSIDVYNSLALIRVLESLENAPLTFARDRYYTMEVRSEREEILFDVVTKKRRLAPYVSPIVRGKIVERRGFSTNMFKPAYVKPKMQIKPTDALKRTPGEPLSGSLSLAERRAIHIRNALLEQDEMISMLEEVQCMEGLRLGTVTVAGEGYPTVSVSFGRDAALRATLSGSGAYDSPWSDSAAKPLKLIQVKAVVVRQKSGGAIVRDVICGVDAYQALLDRLSDTEKTTLFNSQNRSSPNTNVELGPRTAEKIVYQGTIGQFNFFTYSDTYQDADGTDVEVMPADEIILAGPDIEGTRCYGAILDPRAGLQALPRFPKNWMEEDPAADWVMTQAAPLMVPARPNASASFKVL